VDLTSIDGFNVITAQTVISEIGTDMTGFRNENHFASWLGLTPSHDVSGGKIVGSGRRKLQNRVAVALRMASTTLLNSKSYLGGRYRHLRKQLPSHAAAVRAMARYLAVLVYRMLTRGEAWVDRGAARFEQWRTELELTNLNVKAKAKGFKLVPITEAI
jgi:transposase